MARTNLATYCNYVHIWIVPDAAVRQPVPPPVASPRPSVRHNPPESILDGQGSPPASPAVTN